MVHFEAWCYSCRTCVEFFCILLLGTFSASLVSFGSGLFRRTARLVFAKLVVLVTGQEYVDSFLATLQQPIDGSQVVLGLWFHESFCIGSSSLQLTCPAALWREASTTFYHVRQYGTCWLANHAYPRLPYFCCKLWWVWVGLQVPSSSPVFCTVVPVEEAQLGQSWWQL